MADSIYEAQVEFDSLAAGGLGLPFNPNDGITSMMQITSGFRWPPRRIFHYDRWWRWYSNDFRTLFDAQANLTNGLTLLASLLDIMKLPVFQTTSQYYQDTLWAKRPTIQSELPDMEVWLDAHNYTNFAEFDIAAEYLSVFGWFCVATYSDGTVRAINPMNLVEVVNPVDEREIIGHCIVWPYREPEENNWITNRDQERTDRFKVVRVWKDDTPSTESIYQGNGVIIGNVMPESNEIPSLCTGVFTFGNKRGWYDAIQDPAKEIMMQGTLTKRSLHRFSDPHLLIPQSAMQTQYLPPGADRPVEVSGHAAFSARLIEGRGTVIVKPSDDTSTDYGYLVYEVDVTSHLLFMRHLFDQIYLISGVSPISVGQNAGLNQSGEAKRQGMQRSAQLIEEWRNAFTYLFPFIAQAMGAPTGDDPQKAVSFAWPNDPFADVAETFKVVESIFKLGGATLGELRAAGQMPPMTEGQKAELEEAKEAEQEANMAMAEASNNEDEPPVQENE